jgi:hypothetical protein
MIAGDREFAAELLFVDRHQASTATRQTAKYTEHTVLGTVYQFDDARRRFLFVGSVDAQQSAIADAGNFSRLGAARNGDANDRRRAMGVFVPFGGARQQFAVTIAAGNVGKHNSGQRAGMMQALSSPFDVSAIGKLAQHAVERRPVRILRAKGAGDLARTHFAGALANKG